MKGLTCQDRRVIRSELRSKVEAFFPVGFAGGEFAAYGKISAPSAPFPLALVEEPAAQSFQLPAQ